MYAPSDKNEIENEGVPLRGAGRPDDVSRAPDSGSGVMYSLRLELESIQYRCREPHYGQEHQSRAGDLAPQTSLFLRREALKRHPASLYNWEKMSLKERVALAIASAGTVTFDDDYLDEL